MTATRRRSLGLVLAALLLTGAWQALADSCGSTISGWHCGPISTVAALSQDALFLTAAAHANDSPSAARPSTEGLPADFTAQGGMPLGAIPAQSAGLLLLGAGFAVAGQSLKRRTLPVQPGVRAVR